MAQLGAPGRILEQITAHAVNLFYPPVCAICSSALDNEALAAEPRAPLCSDCRPLPALPAGQEQSCICCASREALLAAGGSRCLICSAFPPSFRSLRSALIYSGKIKQVLTRLKYGDQRGLIRYGAALLAAVAEGSEAPAFPSADWDLILPLPSSLNSMRVRGFSHTGLLACALSRRLGVPHASLVLRSCRRRSPQVGLRLNERVRNVSSGFRAHEGVAGKKILLIDDIATSGASIEAASAAIMQAGALFVDAAVIARSPRLDNNRVAAALLRRCSLQRLE